MTQEERVKLCLQCRFKKFDVNRGLLCNKTGQPADFEEECVNFWHESHYSRKEADIQPVKSGHLKTLIVFASTLVAELLLVASLALTKSYNDLFIVGLGAVLANVLIYIAILTGKKWAKSLLTIVTTFVAFGGLLFIAISSMYFNVSPNLILKLVAAIIICSIIAYYINFSKSFLRFFDFQNKKK
ncbi:MAG: hypothetical protein WCJ61_04015 [Paludibacter sp.]